MKTKQILTTAALTLMSVTAMAQNQSVVNTSDSKFAKLESVNLSDVKWTDGFWADRFHVCEHDMVPHMMACYMDDTISHAFANFKIAAGLMDGKHVDPPFHDGDFYKMLEALIVVNADQKDPKVDQEIDDIIEVIGKSQRADGYIHTPVVIKERQNPDQDEHFAERMDFETYNMGHLMTAGCLHYRLTGKKNLLNIAIKATDFLYDYYKNHAFDLAQNAICPSHYMGVVEMYRTLKDPRYLELAKGLVDIRDMVENGEDHNQDRIPFRQQTKAMGHAVRANYLYAGVADVYAETGDETLLSTLENIWDDLTGNKMYITGACGALYDGVSPNGTTYDQPLIQQVHQAYGQDFELPNLTAHNESCANIGNLLWQWRMLQVTGEAKYADVMETVMYNSLLGAVSLNGINHFYANPLATSEDSPLDLRWSKTREPYITYCNCCPPNTARTVAEINNYMYSLSDGGLFVNFYGANQLTTTLKNGDKIALTQSTNYPWSGDVTLTFDAKVKKEVTISLRVPAWCHSAVLTVNGEAVAAELTPGSYVPVTRQWKKGDVIQFNMDMPVRLMQSNPLVEANQGLVAAQRGPVVYCLESTDLPAGVKVGRVAVDASKEMKPVETEIAGAKMMALLGTGVLIDNGQWQGGLYAPLSTGIAKNITLKLIPYYAWDNRGKNDMSVWIPYVR
ncbi:MAG: glycoside hydrolase family 127 protein [Mangrovibacterium sp.]